MHLADTEHSGTHRCAKLEASEESTTTELEFVHDVGEWVIRVDSNCCRLWVSYCPYCGQKLPVPEL